MTQLDEVAPAAALHTEIDHLVVQVGAPEDTLDLLAVALSGPRIGLKRADQHQSTIDIARLNAEIGFDDETQAEVCDAAEVERIAEREVEMGS
jgi:hypothetical protein